MANFSISDFREAIESEGGLARSSYYIVEVFYNLPNQSPEPSISGTPTNIEVNVNRNLNRNIPFLCRAADLPAVSITPVQLHYFTRPVKIPGAREYSPLTLTFFNTNNYNVRRFFEQWQSLLSSHESNSRTTTVSDPQSSATIILTPMNAAGKRLNQYQFVGAFPTVISGLQFTFDSDAEVQTFTVQFEYQHMGFDTSGLSFFSSFPFESLTEILVDFAADTLTRSKSDVYNELMTRIQSYDQKPVPTPKQPPVIPSRERTPRNS